MKIFLLIGAVCFYLTSCGSREVAENQSEPLKEGLVITELMANNDTLDFEASGQTPDWIEVYNNTNVSVDLSDYYLSDNSKNPLMSQLNGVVQPGSYTVFYASGVDTLENHLSFKLNNAGETVSLYSKDKSLVNQVKFPLLPKNVSYVYTNKGWFFTEQCTPSDPHLSAELYLNLSEHLSVNYTESESRVMVSFSSKNTSEFKYKILEKGKPEEEYQVFKNPFTITPGQVIKVKALGENILDHKALLSSYVPVSNHTLPVVSLVTNPKNLWDEKKGLYTDKNCGYKEDKWQRPALVSVYKEDTILNHRIDFKIFGNASRTLPKKSLSFKSKTEFENILFERNNEDAVDGFLVRACHTGMTMYRNEFMNDLNQSIDGHMRMQEYVPSILYLNGEYWGVYNIMERKNDEFIKNHIGHNATQMITANDRQIKPAKGDHNQFIKAIKNINQLTNQKELNAAIESTFRLEEIIDFWAHELFVGRIDTYNNRFWKSDLADDKRWGVITFDYDIILGRPNSTTVIDKYFFSEPDTSLKFFNSFMRSGKYKNKVIYRLCELMNTAYTSNRSDEILDNYYSLTHKEFLTDTARWNIETGRSRLMTLDQVKSRYENYFQKRSTFLIDSIFPKVGFTEKIELVIPEDFQGKVLVNELEAKGTVTFYAGMKFNVKVKPDTGVKFTGWKNGSENYTKEEFQFDNSTKLTLTYELIN